MYQKCFFLLTAIVISQNIPAWAKYTNPNISREQQSCINRGNSYAKSGKEAKATAAYESAFATATDANQCVAIVQGTEKYGRVLTEARRSGLNRALALATNEQDLFAIATEARKNELYDVTKAAIDAIVAKAPEKNDLYELARKAQQAGMNDVAHMALQRAYAQTKSVDEALAFAKQAKIMGTDDLGRKAVKDVIDDATETHELCSLLPQIEALGYSDLMRRALRKALDFGKNFDDCKEIFEAAKHYDQQDVANLASYRGKRMVLLQQVRNDKAAYQQQLDEWRAGKMAAQEQQAAEDLAKQQPQQQPPPNKPTGPGF